MHHQMGVGNAGVNLLDAVDGEDVAGGGAGELVGTVAGATGDGQGVDLGGLDELGRLFRVGQHLVVGQLALGADAVLFTGLARFQRPQAAQFTLHRYTAGMGHLHRLAGDAHVVVIVHGRLAILAQ